MVGRNNADLSFMPAKDAHNRAGDWVGYPMYYCKT